MQVHRSSWIFRIAFMFTPWDEEPERVDRCTLVGRFLLHLVPWLILSILCWLFFGLFLGVFGHIFRWPWLFLIQARYPVYEGGDCMVFLWLPGNGPLEKLCILNWGKKDIRWLDWMVWLMNFDRREKDGWPVEFKTRSPLFFLFFCCFILLVLGVVFYFAPFVAAPLLWHELGGAAVSYVRETAGWWAWTIGVSAAAGALSIILWRAWHLFAASQSGAILISHLKEWKQAHCPIYEVV